MRLANFIHANLEPILAEWDAFAGSLAPGRTMTKRALRDDAGAILRAIARDMQESQSLTQQAKKSKGDGGADTTASDKLDNASKRHAGERVASAFQIDEVVSEYRALRASVLRLWRKSLPQPDLNDIDDITRFSESLDQSLAEAIDSYSERVNRSRQLFLAILGHDLRNPLSCIRTGVQLIQTDGDPVSDEMLAIIGTASESMDNLIKDMMDYASTWLGSAMTLNPKSLDLHKLCREVVDAFRAIHPQRTLHFHARGEPIGNGDADRLRQVISNLLGNAFQHGSPVEPIELSVDSEGASFVLSVHNEGAPIPPDALPTLFDPLVRHVEAESTLRRAPGSVGLGLYIVREIVNAKGGTIEIISTAHQGTTFTVRIPRQLGLIGDESRNEKADDPPAGADRGKEIKGIKTGQDS